jgi:hypothetical protein
MRWSVGWDEEGLDTGGDGDRVAGIGGCTYIAVIASTTPISCIHTPAAELLMTMKRWKTDWKINPASSNNTYKRRRRQVDGADG